MSTWQVFSYQYLKISTLSQVCIKKGKFCSQYLVLFSMYKKGSSVSSIFFNLQQKQDVKRDMGVPSNTYIYCFIINICYEHKASLGSPNILFVFLSMPSNQSKMEMKKSSARAKRCYVFFFLNFIFNYQHIESSCCQIPFPSRYYFLLAKHIGKRYCCPSQVRTNDSKLSVVKKKICLRFSLTERNLHSSFSALISLGNQSRILVGTFSASLS